MSWQNHSANLVVLLNRQSQNPVSFLIQLGFLFAALSGIAYILAKSVFASAAPIDFKYLWLAGELWLEGLTPYSDAFAEKGLQEFPDQNHAQSFSYPPNWFFISAALALFPHDAAAWLWRALSAGLAISATAMMWRAAQGGGTYFSIPFAASLAYVCLMSAAAITLALGQTSFLILFGAALIFFGASRENQAALIAGIVILMLKPQIGAPVSAFLLVQHGGWKTVGAAAAIKLVMTAPAFIVSGPAELITGFLQQLSIYGRVDVNFAASMTGLRHLVFLISGADLSSVMIDAFEIILAALFGLAIRLKNHSPGAKTPALVALWAGILFLTPLHTYDLVLAAPLLVFSLTMNGWRQWVLWAGLALIFRANNFAGVTGMSHPDTVSFPGTTVASFGVLLAAIAAAAYVASNWTSATKENGPA